MTLTTDPCSISPRPMPALFPWQFRCAHPAFRPKLSPSGWRPQLPPSLLISLPCIISLLCMDPHFNHPLTFHLKPLFPCLTAHTLHFKPGQISLLSQVWVMVSDLCWPLSRAWQSLLMFPVISSPLPSVAILRCHLSINSSPLPQVPGYLSVNLENEDASGPVTYSISKYTIPPLGSGKLPIKVPWIPSFPLHHRSSRALNHLLLLLVSQRLF